MVNPTWISRLTGCKLDQIYGAPLDWFDYFPGLNLTPCRHNHDTVHHYTTLKWCLNKIIKIVNFSGPITKGEQLLMKQLPELFYHWWCVLAHVTLCEAAHTTVAVWRNVWWMLESYWGSWEMCTNVQTRIRSRTCYTHMFPCTGHTFILDARSRTNYKTINSLPTRTLDLYSHSSRASSNCESEIKLASTYSIFIPLYYMQTVIK